MKTKQWAMIAYITVIGWIIAYVKRKEAKSPLVNYHLEQALGLIIASIVWSVVIGIIVAVLPASLAGILSVAGLLPLVFMIFGIINASNNAQQPIPVIGKLFENRFVFLRD